MKEEDEGEEEEEEEKEEEEEEGEEEKDEEGDKEGEDSHVAHLVMKLGNRAPHPLGQEQQCGTEQAPSGS